MTSRGEQWRLADPETCMLLLLRWEDKQGKWEGRAVGGVEMTVTVKVYSSPSLSTSSPPPPVQLCGRRSAV